MKNVQNDFETFIVNLLTAIKLIFVKTLLYQNASKIF